MKTIQWQFWATKNRPSGKWSKVHTINPKRQTHTLCGRVIRYDSFKYMYGSVDTYCLKCRTGTGSVEWENK